MLTSSTFTANTVGGTYTVDASVAGVSTPAAFTFTNRYRPPPPTLTRFTPRQGGVGVKVTVVGSNLSGATRVAFNGAPAVIRTDTATKITTWVPTGATTGPIEVTTDGGIGTSATSFRVKYLVVTPSSGAPGASVTAGGSGFKFGEPVVVKYTTGLSNPKSLQICSATAGPDGTVTCAGDIPPPSTAGVTGTHVIEATGRKSKTTVKTTFTLT